MEFTVSKCSLLRVTTKQHISTYEYTMNGTTLNIVSQHPYLGVTLDHNYPGILTLKHSATIDNVCHMDWKRPYYLHSDVMGYPRFAARKLYGLDRWKISLFL